MPKVAITLEAAKAKESDILAKLGKVQQNAQAQKQQTKLNQQRLEWTEQSRKLASEAKRLDDDVSEVAAAWIGQDEEEEDEPQSSQQFITDLWFQVAGIRKLLEQVGRRDAKRARENPEQIVAFQDVIQGVSVALRSAGDYLASEYTALDDECRVPRHSLRRELAAEGVWVVDRRAEDKADLTDEEEALLDRIWTHGGNETYDVELREISDRASGEAAALAKESADLKANYREWDADAHFRFSCIMRQFQGKKRELLNERLALEFPHLTREQLAAHEAHCDSLKYIRQKQAASYRQWRRDRLDLLRKTQDKLEDRLFKQEALAVRRQDVAQTKEKGQKLQAQLKTEKERYEFKLAERRLKEDQIRKKQEAEEARKEEMQRQHAEEIAKQRDLYREQKEEQRKRDEETAVERAQRDAAEMAILTEKNKARVELRWQMDALKAQDQQRRKEEKERERLEQEERLNRAFDKFAPNVERDPDRLLKLPERTKHGAQYVEPVQCVTRGKVASYVDEGRLMSDARYKLSAALQAAGLYGSDAGHAALKAVAAPRPAQPHIMSRWMFA